MIVIAKRFVTYVSPRNLGPSPREVGFSLGNNHVVGEELFFPQEHGCSSWQFKPCSFGNMVVP